MDVFMSLPFSEDFKKVSEVIKEVARRRELQAYRVDGGNLGVPLAEVITAKIRESRVVVADVTGNNPNVLNEVGQAQILGKPLVLISREVPEDAPFNIRGHRICRCFGI